MGSTPFSLRKADQADQGGIRALIRAVRINPAGLDWRRFVVATDSDDRLIGCGQIKSHGDGARELSSIAVVKSWRGRGVARAIIELLMAEHGPPLWLMCSSSLIPLYQRFGFRTAVDAEQPPYFRRLRRLAGTFEMFMGSGEYLAVMVRDVNLAG